MMCLGESEQLDKSFDYNLTEKEYRDLNFKKNLQPPGRLL